MPKPPHHKGNFLVISIKKKKKSEMDLKRTGNAWGTKVVSGGKQPEVRL